jgi:hypothetical protein
MFTHLDRLGRVGNMLSAATVGEIVGRCGYLAAASVTLRPSRSWTFGRNELAGNQPSSTLCLLGGVVMNVDVVLKCPALTRIEVVAPQVDIDDDSRLTVLVERLKHQVGATLNAEPELLFIFDLRPCKGFGLRVATVEGEADIHVGAAFDLALSDRA